MQKNSVSRHEAYSAAEFMYIQSFNCSRLLVAQIHIFIASKSEISKNRSIGDLIIDFIRARCKGFQRCTRYGDSRPDRDGGIKKKYGLVIPSKSSW